MEKWVNGCFERSAVSDQLSAQGIEERLVEAAYWERMRAEYDAVLRWHCRL